MMRLTRALDTLANGGSYQQEVLRFLEEIIEVLERIEAKTDNNESRNTRPTIDINKVKEYTANIDISKKDASILDGTILLKKVAKKCGRPKGYSPKKK